MPLYNVTVNGVESRSCSLEFGLPQGSCLGPLVFTIYVGELLEIVKPLLPTVMCYADDTQLYMSFSPKEETGEVEALANMEKCINDIHNWMKDVKLKLNSDKIDHELILIGTKLQLAKVKTTHLSVGNDQITPSKVVKK